MVSQFLPVYYPVARPGDVYRATKPVKKRALKKTRRIVAKRGGETLAGEGFNRKAMVKKENKLREYRAKYDDCASQRTAQDELNITQRRCPDVHSVFSANKGIGHKLGTLHRRQSTPKKIEP